MSNAPKKNDTGLRVLEVLKILLREPVSGEDLIKQIEHRNDIESIYTKETLLKYFATLQLLGLVVEKQKKNAKYALRKLPVEINLSEEELKVLCLLSGYVNNLSNPKILGLFNGVLDNFERSFSEETLQTYKKLRNNNKIKSDIELLCHSSIVAQFESFCSDAQKLKISYLSHSKRATEVFIVEPKSVIHDSRKSYLFAYNGRSGQNQKLLLDNITHVVQLPQKNTRRIMTNTIVFELKGSLSRSYRLKEGEKVIDSSQDSIIVSNSDEDKNILFKRLIKYGENCKILQPGTARQEFSELLSQMILNLKSES